MRLVSFPVTTYQPVPKPAAGGVRFGEKVPDDGSLPDPLEEVFRNSNLTVRQLRVLQRFFWHEDGVTYTNFDILKAVVDARRANRKSLEHWALTPFIGPLAMHPEMNEIMSQVPYGRKYDFSASLLESLDALTAVGLLKRDGPVDPARACWWLSKAGKEALKLPERFQDALSRRNAVSLPDLHSCGDIVVRRNQGVNKPLQLKAVLSVDRNGTVGWDLLDRIRQLDKQRGWTSRTLASGISSEVLFSVPGFNKPEDLAPAIQALEDAGYVRRVTGAIGGDRIVLTAEAESVLAHESMADFMETLPVEDIQAVLDLFIEAHEQEAKRRDAFIEDLESRYQAATSRLSEARARHRELQDHANREANGVLALQAEQQQSEIELLAGQTAELAAYLENALLDAIDKETEQRRQCLVLQDAKIKAELRDIGKNYLTVFKTTSNEGKVPSGKLVREVALSSAARKYAALGDDPEGSAMARHELGERRVQRALERLQRVKSAVPGAADEEEQAS